MLGVMLAVACAFVLRQVLSSAGLLRVKTSLPLIILSGFALRLVIQLFIREVPFFTHGLGGDALNYEEFARLIAGIWRRVGIHYVTADEFVELGPTSFPENLFACVMYLNGGETTRLGCTSLVALAAGLTAINLYSLATQFGAEHKNALLFACLIYFQPAFLFYTSDMYKDGLVLVFAIGALGSALRLSFRFSFLHAAIGILCAWALWYVRFYLIYVTVAPLLVGIVGIRTKSVARPLFTALGLAVAAVALAGFTDILQLTTETASNTFALGTSARALAANAGGGSGVVFDDGGSPYGALPAKLAYTLFAPFPWAGGSLGFQLGKLDVALWYFTLYRAGRAAWRADKRLVLMFASFIVPCTLMYAMSMSNVGLIMRQRMVIVVATAVLAAIYTPARSERVERAPSTKAIRALRRARSNVAA